MSNRIWAFVFHIVWMVGFCFNFGNGSLLIFLGLEQSLAKRLSPQLKYLICGLDLWICCL